MVDLLIALLVILGLVTAVGYFVRWQKARKQAKGKGSKLP